MWIKHSFDDKYHFITPDIMVSLLGKIICGYPKTHNLSLKRWEQISGINNDHASICSICKKFYQEYASVERQRELGRNRVRQEAARLVQKWRKERHDQQASLQIEREIKRRGKTSINQNMLHSPSEEARKQQHLEAIAEAKREVEREERKAELALHLRANNLRQEKIGFADWLQEIQYQANQGIVYPGQFITLRNTEQSEEFVVYFVESDPLRTFKSDSYRYSEGYKTYVPVLESGIQLVGTASQLGQTILNQQVGKCITIITVSGVHQYSIVRLEVQADENSYRPDMTSSPEKVFCQPDGTIYEGRGHDINATEGRLSGADRDNLNWSDKHDATKYSGYMAREGNHFGSFPGHDDYSDEATP